MKISKMFQVPPKFWAKIWDLPLAGASKSVRDLFRLPPENFTARGIKDPSSVIFILSLSIDSCAFSLLAKVTNPEDFD